MRGNKLLSIVIISLITLVGCEKKIPTPPSGENTLVENNYENCKKIDWITDTFGYEVMSLFKVKKKSITLEKVECSQKEETLPIVLLNTNIGVIRCKVPGILWLKSGGYAAYEWSEDDDGNLHNGFKNKNICEQISFPGEIVISPNK